MGSGSVRGGGREEGGELGRHAGWHGRVKGGELVIITSSVTTTNSLHGETIKQSTY